MLASRGVDSTVLKHIVDNLYDDVPSVFINTGLEYPEIQKFAMSQPNVETIRLAMRFDEVLKKYGYPIISKENSLYIRQCQNPTNKNAMTIRLRKEGIRSDGTKVSSGKIPQKYMHLIESPIPISEQCCDVMKKRPAHHYESMTEKKSIVGAMAEESRLRYKKRLQYGCNVFESKNPKSQPLSFWTTQDILAYIQKYNMPYCSVYGDIIEKDGKLVTTGCSRTGCIFCGFGCHLEKEPNRFQRLKETHPRQYEYCIGGGEMVDGQWQPNKEGLGLGYVFDYIGVKYK